MPNVTFAPKPVYIFQSTHSDASEKKQSQALRLASEIENLESHKDFIQGKILNIKNSFVKELSKIIPSESAMRILTTNEFPVDKAIKLIKNERGMVKDYISSLDGKVSNKQQLRLKNGNLTPVNSNLISNIIHREKYARQVSDATNLFVDKPQAVNKEYLSNLSEKLNNEKKNLFKSTFTDGISIQREKYDSLISESSKTDNLIALKTQEFDEIVADVKQCVTDQVARDLEIGKKTGKGNGKSIIARHINNLKENPGFSGKKITVQDVAKSIVATYYAHNKNTLSYEKSIIKDYQNNTKGNGMPCIIEAIKIECAEDFNFIGKSERQVRQVKGEVLNGALYVNTNILK